MNPQQPTVSFDAVAGDPESRALVAAADTKLDVLGFNEHGFRHANQAAEIGSRIMRDLGFDSHTQELAKIAGLLHDIGNAISRRSHASTGALLAHGLLSRMGMPPDQTAVIIGAIGSHGDDHGSPGVPTDPISAALILADKTDVHRSRVRRRDASRFDRHDRVGFAVVSSGTSNSSESNRIVFELVMDVRFASPHEFRDLFQRQLIMCRDAADFLSCTFEIAISEVATDYPSVPSWR